MKKSRVILYFVIVLSAFSINFYFRPISGNPLINAEYKRSSAYVNNLYKSDEYFKKNLLKKSEYKIYESIIEASLKDKKNVDILCSESCESTMLNAYYAIYLDHPELISYQGASYRIKDDYITLTNNDNLGKLQTYFGTRRIEREMENIRKDTKNMSDKDKIIYVYNYVASHNYDQLFTYIKSNQSAYSFFTKGTSVCAGFAKASQIIFQNIGLNSYLVLGENHMWNYVEYNGKWYVFDSTVGTSYYDKNDSNYYDGLGETTVEVTKGMFENLYPEIEEKRLRDIFKL